MVNRLTQREDAAAAVSAEVDLHFTLAEIRDIEGCERGHLWQLSSKFGLATRAIESWERGSR